MKVEKVNTDGSAVVTLNEKEVALIKAWSGNTEYPKTWEMLKGDGVVNPETKFPRNLCYDVYTSFLSLQKKVEKGHLVCGKDVPDGSLVQVMRGESSPYEGAYAIRRGESIIIISSRSYYGGSSFDGWNRVDGVTEPIFRLVGPDETVNFSLKGK